MSDAMVSAAVQTGVVLLLCSVVWLFFGRRRESFSAYVGLTGARWPSLLSGAALGVGAALVFAQVEGVHELATAERSVVDSALRSVTGWELVVVLLVTAILKTAFSEELLFRGLIGKRLIRAAGFAVGNLAQALLFGAVHLLLFLIPDAPQHVVMGMIVMVTATGWLNGWLNEKLGGGSILPGWTAHALANALSYLNLAGVLTLPTMANIL